MVREHISKIPARRKDSHKGDYGKVFVIAGSRGMTGAAFLASQGALLAGSGLVINGIPESLNVIMETKLTEVMTLALPETANYSLSREAKQKILDFAKACDAVLLGPGLGRERETEVLVREIVKEIQVPLVLDADGINAFSGNSKLLKKKKCRLVITPHPGEMARLLGKDVDQIMGDRAGFAKDTAKELEATICLKGHKTVVADPEGLFFINETGNSGMATGGTGDVLAGMIASFIGQGIPTFSAAVSAVYLHGLSGDMAAVEKSAFCMTASDLLTYLPKAFAKAGL